jgi:hypothetical protein
VQKKSRTKKKARKKSKKERKRNQNCLHPLSHRAELYLLPA